MTEKELFQEALEWRKYISKLASDYSDQELFKKRLATIEWLVKCAEKVVGNVNLNELTDAIRKWSKDRKLNIADPTKQVLKLGEEFGELCEAMAKGRFEQVIDSVGDMYVVMTILCQQLKVNIEDCIQQAYDEIKSRKGKMINGVFVKEEDLGGRVDS
mgnify:CR=1 FL=1